MSFFIAFFPLIFECAKVQHFIGMAIALENFFYSTKQSTVYQHFKFDILTRRTHWTDRVASASAEVVVYVAVIKTNNKLKTLRIDRQTFVE